MNDDVAPSIRPLDDGWPAPYQMPATCYLCPSRPTHRVAIDGLELFVCTDHVDVASERLRIEALLPMVRRPR